MKLEINWLWRNYCDRPRQIFLATNNHDRQWTYADAWAEVSSLGQALWDLGISRGTKVAVLLKNSPITLFIYLALHNLGAIAICLNYRLSDLEISALLEESQALLLISDRQLLSPCPLINPAELSDRHHRSYPLPHTFDPQCIQGIYFTSGTTGKPKAVPLTYFNHWHSAIAVNQFLGLEHPHWLFCLPLYHVGGMAIVWRTLLAGGSITLVPKFTPEVVIQVMQETDVQVISLVPTMLKRILENSNFSPSLQRWQNLRGIFLGGARADFPLLKQCLDLELPLIITYGMTETASQITALELRKYPNKLGSVGQPLPHAQLKIIPLTNSDVYGEIAIRSPALMAGYVGKNTSQFSEDGYFLTGDLGYWDRDNFLYLVNRRTDLIISGGENIYPAEIEQILQQHPLITEVCVVAKSDPLWGEVPAVVITNNQITLAEIQSFCLKQHLASYKLPKFLMYMPEIPRIGIGKYDRRLLRELLADN